MNKTKKILLTLGTVTTLVAPVTLAISCGNADNPTDQHDHDLTGDDFLKSYKLNATLVNQSTNEVVGIFYVFISKENEIEKVTYYTENNNVSQEDLTHYAIAALDSIIDVSQNKPYLETLIEYKANISMNIDEITIFGQDSSRPSNPVPNDQVVATNPTSNAPINPVPVPPSIPNTNTQIQPTGQQVVQSTPEEDQAMIDEINSWPLLEDGAKLPRDLDFFAYGEHGSAIHLDPVRGPVDDSAATMIREAKAAVARHEDTVSELKPEYDAAVEAMTRAAGSVEAYIAKIEEINNEFLHPSTGIVEGNQARPSGLVDDGQITYTMKTGVAGNVAPFQAHKWHDDSYEYVVSEAGMTKHHLNATQIQSRIVKLESTLLKTPVNQLINSTYGHNMTLVWYPNGGGGASHGGEQEVGMSTEVPGDDGASEILYHEIGHGLFKAAPLGMIDPDKRFEMTLSKMRECGFGNLATEIERMRNNGAQNFGYEAIGAHNSSPWMFSYTEENAHLVNGAPQYPQYEANFKNAIAYFNQWPNVDIAPTETSLPRISVEEYGMSLEEVLTRLLLQATWVNPENSVIVNPDGKLNTWNEAFNEMVMIKIWSNDSMWDEHGHLKDGGKEFLSYALGRNNPLAVTGSFSGTDFTKLRIISGTDYDHVTIKWLDKPATKYSTKETFSGNLQFKDTFDAYSDQIYNYNIYKQEIIIDTDHRAKANWNQEAFDHLITDHAEIEFWKDASETEKVPTSELILNSGVQEDPATGRLYIR